MILLAKTEIKNVDEMSYGEWMSKYLEQKKKRVKTCYIYQQNPDGHERCHRAKEKERKYQLKETT